MLMLCLKCASPGRISKVSIVQTVDFIVVLRLNVSACLSVKLS